MDLVVRWDKMGPEFTYIVWYSKKPKGPWLRYNDIRLTDDIIDRLRNIEQGYYTSLAYNEYYIRNLSSQTNYSIKVTCHDRYDAWWYSQSDYDSISGGMNGEETMPSPNSGNIIGFQFYVQT